jgi:hypothetical protein
MPKKQGRGRPKKGSAERKSESVLLKLELGEKQAFADAAAMAGVPLSVWIRERLRRVARAELESANRIVQFLRVTIPE